MPDRLLSPISDIPEAQAVVMAAEEDRALLQRGWPAAIDLVSEPGPDYYELPLYYLGAFPTLRPEDVRPLVLWCRLFLGSIYLQDRILDGQCTSDEAASYTLRVTAMQMEGTRALHAIFPPTARFWDHQWGYLREYTDACLAERALGTGATPWQQIPEAELLRILIGRYRPGMAVIDGLCELTGDYHLREPLLDAVEGFCIATQMVDDLKDWRDDLLRGVPSLLLSRVAAGRLMTTDDVERQRCFREIGREIYCGGHALYTIDVALAGLDRAERFLGTLPLHIHRLTGALRAGFVSLRADVVSRAERMQARARVAS